MARPWQIKPWPYVRRDGDKSWRIGYRDDKGKTRAKAFTTARAARTWTRDYSAAERRGIESLRRFLADEAHAGTTGAKGSQAATEQAAPSPASPPGRPLGEVVSLFLHHNRPEAQGGLAVTTHRTFSCLANRHLLGEPGQDRRHRPLPPYPHAERIAAAPAASFNGPEAPRAYREEMIRAGITLSNRQHVWVVLSSCLSWAAVTDLVPEIRTNGCKLANEQQTSKRRSSRRGGTGVAAQPRPARQGQGAESWALSALAVEHIRARMLLRTKQRSPVLPWRDAVTVSLQYGLGTRNGETFALRWASLGEEAMDILESLAAGHLDEGKTYSSTPRQTTIPSLLFEDLAHWRRLLVRHGHPTQPHDFILPGDLAGKRYGKRDERLGGVHYTKEQQSKWGQKFLRPAVEWVAANVEGMAGIAEATEYSLRRGTITARLRSEDPGIVVAECGTSLEVASRHYSFALRGYRHAPGCSHDELWREAREHVSSLALAA